jgi:DnaJ-class molecular chaperone with C-terminal Zn finger domain
MAKRYHPDANSTAFNTVRFQEVKEAYDVLSDTNKRKRYDEERWLNGMGNRARDKQAITPEWILKESTKLAKHMSTIDRYRMSHSALHDYVFLLLSDAHMLMLEDAADSNTNKQIIAQLLASTIGLRHEHMQHVATRLARLAGSDGELIAHIYSHHRTSHHRALWDKYFTAIIIGVAILLCVLMFLWGRR